MEIERTEDRGVTVVEVRGVINFGEPAQEFSAYLHDLLAADVPAVLVDSRYVDTDEVAARSDAGSATIAASSSAADASAGVASP